MIGLTIFSKISGFSYASLPQTDAFFLTLALVAIFFPPFLLFFTSPIYNKIRELVYFISISSTGKCKNIKNFSCPLEREDTGNQTLFKANPGNFLALASGLNTVLRLSAQKASAEEMPEETDCDSISAILFEKDILTRRGRNKLRFIGWLKQRIVSGGVGRISQKTLALGMKTIWEVNKDFNSWLSSKN